MRRAILTVLPILLILVVGGGISYAVYEQQRRELVADASTDLHGAREAFVDALDRMFDPAPGLHEGLIDSSIRERDGEALADLFFGLATGAVRRYDQVDGAYLGFPDGRFLHVQDLPPEAATDGGPTAGGRDRILRREIDDSASTTTPPWEMLDESGTWTPSGIDSRPFDPRERIWYRQAVESGTPVWTEPYTFASSGALGVTYAEPIYDRNGALWAVMGVDLSLESLSRTLVDTAEALADIGDVVFATDLGARVVGHPDFVQDTGKLSHSTEAFLDRYRDPGSFERKLIQAVGRNGDVQTIRQGDHHYLVTMDRLDPERAMPLQIYLARDMDKILETAVTGLRRNVILLFVAIVAFGVVAFHAIKLRVEIAARERAEAELIEARDTAEAATRAKSTFLATMSHEIRTPMNGVMSMTELLAVTRLDAEQRRMARIIRDSADSLLTIINDILDFSKIEAGKLDIEAVPFSLMGVVDGAAALLAPRAETKGLDLVVDIDPAIIDDRVGDPTRLRQVLLNLGGNAVKFTEAGTIGIRVCESETIDGGLRFEVSDTGIGLGPEQQARLFQPFVQADSSTSRRFGGTGLGLSICQRLAGLMGGRIGVDSAEGAGSVFWFELPLPAEGTAAPSPHDDLSAAVVHLIGLPAAVAAVTERYLRAAGITAIHRSEKPEPSTADLWLIAGAAADPESLDRLEGTIALVSRRDAVAGLSPSLRTLAATVLTTPLDRESLWRATAIALGLEASADTGPAERPDLAFAPPSVEEARRAGALVLVAEDNETNQVVIRQMLGRLGVACEIAGNGRIALTMLATPDHGLLLTDVNMPEMDGFALAREIRRCEADGNPRLPILALTADALAGVEQDCLAAGMDGFLTKPIDSRALAAAIARHLPQALPLRRLAAEREPEPERTEAAAAAAPAPDWDRDIFDPAVLAEAFGSLDDEAKAFVEKAAATWDGRVAEIEARLAEGDPEKARAGAHALKGAALSVGARRLGTIAADIQDYLDGDDDEMAAVMAELLRPTLTEFQETLPRILAQ